MSFSAAMLSAFLAEGMTLEAVVRIAEAAEGGPKPPRVTPKPDNDRVRRMTSEQRRRVYELLAERDGEQCGECAAESHQIWRRMGVSSNGTWEWDAEYRNLITNVCPTSNLEVDHQKPLWAGGDNDLNNLWLLCIDCHKIKTSAEASQRRRA